MTKVIIRIIMIVFVKIFELIIRLIGLLIQGLEYLIDNLTEEIK